MNNKHCGMIKDLLPLYVDQLTSEESNEAIKEHLSTCESCTTIYETLKTNGELTSEDTGKELDYLKKVKAKRKSFLLVAVGICIVVFGILTAIGVKTFIIGTPISLAEISYTNDENYNGIGTKFDPETNELTLYGELLSERMAFSGIKAEESKRLVGVYNVTVYGVPRFSDSRDYSRRFKKVIKIPDNNMIWSVYSLGEIPQDTYCIWSNDDVLEQKYAQPKAKLTEYLTAHKGFLPESNRLDFSYFDDILGEPCYVFYRVENAGGLEAISSTTDCAVSEDGSKIYIYEREKDVWEKVSEQPKAIDAAALWNARTEFVGDNSAVGKLIGLLPTPSDLKYDHFEMHTAAKPYGIEIVYSVSTEELKQYDTEDAKTAHPFRRNALLLLALVDNADQIQVTLTDGTREVSFANGREWAEDMVGSDVRTFAASASELQKLVDFPLE